MLLTIACLLMRWVPGPAVLVFRGDLAKDAELVGAGNYVTSCDLRKLMDQSAEPVAPAQLRGQPVHVRLRAGRVPGAVRGDRARLWGSITRSGLIWAVFRAEIIAE
jgi:hypothetical protein